MTVFKDTLVGSHCLVTVSNDTHLGSQCLVTVSKDTPTCCLYKLCVVPWNDTLIKMASSTSSMCACSCEIMYSPFLKCGEPAFNTNTDGASGVKKLCLFHLYNARKEDDCAICLGEMCGDTYDVFILACGHMFHKDCLGKCAKPQCPMCRTQFLPEEAVIVFYSKVLHNIGIRLYGLPLKSIEYVLACFEVVLSVARVSTDATQLMFQRLIRRYSALFV